MKKLIISTAMLCSLFGRAGTALAQEDIAREQGKRAWELSLGGHALGFTRLHMMQGAKISSGYLIEMDKRDVLLAPSLALTRELSPHFALQLSQTTAFEKKAILSLSEVKFQYRLGHYFRQNPYIDPYVGVGAGYLYNGLASKYTTSTTIDGKPATWSLHGLEAEKNLVPINFHAGVNLWASDRFGVNLEGGYLLSAKHISTKGFWHAGLKLSYRIGGNSKAINRKPEVVYVDKVVETIKHIPVVEVKEREILVHEILDNIYFAFDSAELTPASLEQVDKLAELLQKDEKRYLITGYTDAVGSDVYNEKLSMERAKAVADALIERGLSADRLKSVGVGRKVALAKAESPNDARAIDRKIRIEVIDNDAYWQAIK